MKHKNPRLNQNIKKILTRDMLTSLTLCSFLKMTSAVHMVGVVYTAVQQDPRQLPVDPHMPVVRWWFS
jgi:hypothetical protein